MNRVILLRPIIKFFIAICFLSLYSSCFFKSKEEKAEDIIYEGMVKVIQYANWHAVDIDRDYQVGYALGGARFKFDFDKRILILRGSVHTTFEGYLTHGDSDKMSAEEVGLLSDFDFKHESTLVNSQNLRFYPFTLLADWQPNGSGGGLLQIGLREDNVIVFYLGGESNWHASLTYHCAKQDDVVGDILEIVNDTKKQLFDLYGTSSSFSPIERFSNDVEQIGDDISSTPTEEPDEELVEIEESDIYEYNLQSPSEIEITEPVFCDENKAFNFISDMYNNVLYSSYEFLEANCTERMINLLKAEYDYDCDDTCYATWLFRSMSQDGINDKHEILNIKKDGDWYTYRANDGGVLFTRSILLVDRDGDIKIDYIIKR